MAAGTNPRDRRGGSTRGARPARARRLARMLWVGLFAAGGTLLSCGGNDTALVVVVDTDLASATPLFDRVDLTVTGPAGRPQRASTQLAGASRVRFPLTTYVVPARAGTDVALRVLVEGYHLGQRVLQREATTAFVPRQTRTLRLDLFASCLDVACPSGTSCGLHGCEAVARDPANLPVGSSGLTAADAGALPAASVFVATAGSDSNPCTRDLPCRSLRRAYRAAPPGAVIELGAGEYPAQSILDDARGADAAFVVFRPAPGAVVTLGGDSEITASRVELRDMAVRRCRIAAPADGVVLRNVKAATFEIASGRGVSILGGEIGPSSGESPIVGNAVQSAVPERVVIEGVRFHDRHAGSRPYASCLSVAGAREVRIRRNSFQRCESVGSIHVTRLDPAVPSERVVIENNVIYSNDRAETRDDVPGLRLELQPGLLVRYASVAAGPQSTRS